jgi:outer membrane assembly lipoprotein YfiO
MPRLRLAVWSVVLAAAACHHGAGVAKGPTPEQTVARANQAFRHGDFRRAQELYQQLLFDLGPGDPQLPEVRYFLAESNFQLGQMIEAAHQFRQVADQFPASAYAPVALLRAGDANLRSWHDPDLDPSYGQAALAIYQELQGRYPETDAAARARMHATQLRGWLADKSYKNGLFYLRRRAYDSAIIYFKDVIATYPETPRVADALLRLIDAYSAIGYATELRETCDNLRRYHPEAAGQARACPADSTAAR